MLLKRLVLTGSFILDYIAHYPMRHRSRERMGGVSMYCDW